jgi:HEAT repeat protein
MNWKAGIILVAVGLLAGCYSPEPASLGSDSAATAVPAIKDAAAHDDHRAVPRLVQFLEDNDPAIRFAAINALHRITGQTFDYRYYDDEMQRKAAVLRWQQWLKQHPAE